MLRIPESVRTEIRTKATRGERRHNLAREYQISIRSIYNILAEQRMTAFDAFRKYG